MNAEWDVVNRKGGVSGNPIKKHKISSEMVGTRIPVSAGLVKMDVV